MTAKKGNTVATTSPNKRDRIVRNSIGQPICACRALRAGVGVLIVGLVFGRFYAECTLQVNAGAIVKE
jgi:hypothetical protein